MTTVINWISANYIELIGSTLGVIYVLLAIKQNIWCWPVGIISVVFYIIIFFIASLYGDMTLQIFYLIMGFYGWYAWYYTKDKTEETSISQIKNTHLFIMLLFVVVITPVFGYVLTFTNDTIPYWDGFTTALGLAGTWMTARKYIENWLLWIFANAVCVGVFYHKGLYPTVVYYIIMTVLAYKGFWTWKKAMTTIKND